MGGDQGAAVLRKPGKKIGTERKGTEILGNPIPIPESGKMGGVVSHLTFFVKHLFSCDFYNFTLYTSAKLNQS